MTNIDDNMYIRTVVHPNTHRYVEIDTRQIDLSDSATAKLSEDDLLAIERSDNPVATFVDMVGPTNAGIALKKELS